MLKYKDYVYIKAMNTIIQVSNVGKKSYSFRYVCGVDPFNIAKHKSLKGSCHHMIRQKEWVIGELQTLKLLYGI